MLFQLAFIWSSALSMTTPQPIVWNSYTITDKVLTFSYPIYSSSATYNIKYDNQSLTYFLPSTTKTTSSIQCYLSDSTQLLISYSVTDSSITSSFSSSVTLLCAGLPNAITSLSYTSVLKKVTLSWTSVDGNGNLLEGYRVKRYLTSWTEIGTTSASVLTYTDEVSYDIEYTYAVYAYNQVGDASSSVSLKVKITQTADTGTSTITFPSSLYVGYASEFKVNMKDSGGNTVINPSLMLLEIRDVCSANNGYECIRVSESDSNYISDLLLGFEYVKLTSNNDGTMSAFYTPKIHGPYSFSIIQLQTYGLLSDVWDNIWFLSPLDKSYTVSNLDLTWSDGTLLSTYSSEYVSSKFFTFLYVPYNENYTFYLIADDNFRLYIDGVLLISAWDVCCEEFSAFIELSADTYYFLQIEFRQLDTAASLFIYWSSGVFSKESIPDEYLFWPKRVNGSPWIQTVEIGLSTVENCYFIGNTSMVSGVIYTFLMYSVDIYGELIDNSDDVFAVELVGLENYYFVSTYAGDGMSFANVIPGLSGEYTVNVLLYGEHIKGSPYTAIIEAGYPNAWISFFDVPDNVTAGVMNSMKVELKDAYGNDCSGAEVTMYIVYDNSDEFISPIGVPGVDQSSFGFVHSGHYIEGFLVYVLYIAGDHNISIFLDQELALSYTLKVIPADLYSPYSIPVFESTSVIAGNPFSFQIQLRDIYYNNLIIDSASSYSLTSSSSEIIEILTLNISLGVATFEFTPTKTGTFILTLYMEELNVPNLPAYTVDPADLSIEFSYIISPSSAITGETVIVSIYAQDIFLNMRNSGDIFTSDINGTSTVLEGTITDKGKGVHELFFIPYIIDTYTVTIFSSSSILGTSQSILVSLSNIRGLTSIFNTFSSQTAGKGSLTITSKDIGENIVTNPVESSYISNQKYYASLQGNQNLILSSSFTDFTAYKISLTSVTIAGTYSICLALMEENGLNGFYYRDNSFQGLFAVNNYHNHLNTLPQYFTSKDSVLDFDFSTMSYPDFFSAHWNGCIIPPASDTYTFYLESDNKVRLTLNSLVVINTISDSIESGSILLSSGNCYTTMIEYVNGGNNGFFKFSWSSSSIVKEVVGSSYLFNEVFSETSPYELTIIPDSTTANMCLLSQYPGDTDDLTRAYVKTIKYFLVTARDKYGNQALTTTDIFTATLTLSTTSVTVTIVSESPGKYKGSFTASTAGTYTLKLSLSVSSVLTTVTSTYINVLTGPTDPTKTSLLDVPSSLMAGVEGGFIIIAKDAAGTQQIKGGDKVEISMFNDTKIVPSTQISIYDNNDGSYTAKVIVFLIGYYTTQIYMNSVLALTVYINITSAGLDLTTSTISVPTPDTFGSTISSDIYLKDPYGNPIYVTQNIFVYMTKEINSNFKPLKFAITTQDLPKGYYKATADYTLANVDRSGLCTSSDISSSCDFIGDLTIWSGIFDPKLLGKYYSNPTATGTESFTQRDSTISFTWDTTIQGLSLNNTSVVWLGFVKPTSTKSYTLYITGDDWGEVFWDGVSIMNSETVTSISLSLSNTEYYLLKVVFNNTQDTAAVKLEWMDTSRVTVPSSVLFYMLNSSPISGLLLLYTSVTTIIE